MKYEQSVETITSLSLAFLLIISVMVSCELYRRNKENKRKLVEAVEINTFNINQNKNLIDVLSAKQNKIIKVEVAEHIRKHSELRPLPKDLVEKEVEPRH